METAIQQCAQDFFETNLSHESKTIIVDILHKHLTTEKEQIIEAYNTGWQYGFLSTDRESVVKTKNHEEYYNETFEVFNQ